MAYQVIYNNIHCVGRTRDIIYDMYVTYIVTYIYVYMSFLIYIYVFICCVLVDCRLYVE